MDDTQTTGGLIAAVFLVALVFFAIGATVTRDKIVTQEGITGSDLDRAFHRCRPPLATFEQDLACTQAVYGGHP